MNSMEDALLQFPCYPHNELVLQSFSGEKPISTTYPYEKGLVTHRLIKKILNKKEGDIFVTSFTHDNHPLLLDGSTTKFSVEDVDYEVKVLNQFHYTQKGYRAYAFVCQYLRGKNDNHN
ncbi:hypothetical protein SC206_19135 [Rouxiella sp. T17]|uniref:hypothetical protein n=1 Tax=Rouxiella sp. T17 TaxID=3085684 RepID=UPI002FC633EB